ncbi:5719_t:CDS:2, partial [Gigaspora rosea]
FRIVKRLELQIRVFTNVWNANTSERNWEQLGSHNSLLKAKSDS